MNSYQIVNGIPRHINQPLEKVDFNKTKEIHKQSPSAQLEQLGFTQKQSFSLQLSKAWNEIKESLPNTTKSNILCIAARYNDSI